MVHAPSHTLHLFRPSRYRFMQDGASVHRARTTMNWLTTNGVRLFNGGIWPPNSPDMNPIEHVWPLVPRQLAGRVFSGRDDLWAALVVAFGRITPAQIVSLFASMPRRIAALKKAKGGHTRY